MDSGTILNVGFDDTDSPVGMCTTFLAYKIAGSLCGPAVTRADQSTGGSARRRPSQGAGTRQGSRAQAEFLDYPRLVRLNPNIPWKTRGNGAVSMRIRTTDPQGAKNLIRDMVFDYADTEHGANPGLVFFEGSEIPGQLAEFARLALWQLIGRGDARRLAQRNGLEFYLGGNGQGLVGAMGAAGYGWRDHTMELLSYRRPSRLGTRRRISAQGVKSMQDRTSPNTFNSFDERRHRVMITPRGPDPVFYGIRGEDAGTLVYATGMLRRGGEDADGYMIFRTNQGTGDHLQNQLTPNAMRPYASGWMSGTVAAAPVTGMGGHTFFEIDADCSAAGRVVCAVYRPTRIATTAMNLAVGDKVRVGGGVRRASKNHPRAVNVEYLHVQELAGTFCLANPACMTCGKRMKSKGRGQGFACARCKDSRARSKIRCRVPRKIKRGLYLPDPAAHRHLTRPQQRLGVFNTELKFDDGIPWLRVYKSSGE